MATAVTHLLYERAARDRKARDLADVLAEAGAAVDDLGHLSEMAWLLATKVISDRRGYRCGVPSIETRALVGRILAARETVERDPFAGLPS